MGRWDKAAEKVGGGLFMQLQPGTFKIRVLSDPVVQNKQFDNGPATIFSWIVYDYQTQKVRILSKGPSFLNKFNFFGESWGDKIPMSCDIVIKVEGSGLQTRYDFAAVPPRDEMAADWKEQMQKVDLLQAVPGSFTMDQWIRSTDSPVAQAERSVAQDITTHDIGPIDKGSGLQTRIDTGDIGDEPIDLNDIPF